MKKKQCKTYLVLGAGGSIGFSVVSRLLAKGHSVVACVQRDRGEAVELQKRGALLCVGYDATHGGQMNNLLKALKSLPCRQIDGIIYAVGHCPPDGFKNEAREVLSNLDIGKYENEFRMHMRGPLVVFRSFIRDLNTDGCFLFVSSAITRMKGKFPPDVHLEFHASVIAGMDWLIDGMRKDPVTIEYKYKIHRIAPAAVNTPFHRRPKGAHGSKLIPLSTVVDEIVLALQSDTHVDKEILPPA